jgi:diguanylate cyclase (GGDEF)-like protein
LLLGRDERCHIHVYDDAASRFHATLSLEEDGTYRIADQRSTNGTYVNDDRVSVHPLKDGDRIGVGRHIFRFLMGTNVEMLYQEAIAQLAMSDALTGLPNRRALVSFLSQELARCARHSRPMSLVLFEVDGFEALHARVGLLGADSVLRQLAERLQEAVTNDHLLARYSAGTFALALPDCTVEDASHLAERLRLLVNSVPFSFGNESFALTLSLGGATARQGEVPPPSLIMRADRYLRRAKEEGRDSYKGEARNPSGPATPQ